MTKIKKWRGKGFYDSKEEAIKAMGTGWNAKREKWWRCKNCGASALIEPSTTTNQWYVI